LFVNPAEWKMAEFFVLSTLRRIAVGRPIRRSKRQSCASSRSTENARPVAGDGRFFDS